MNAQELLRIIDSIHREKNIEKDVVFQAIESALVSAAKKHYGETELVEVKIDRIHETSSTTGTERAWPVPG